MVFGVSGAFKVFRSFRVCKVSGVFGVLVFRVVRVAKFFGVGHAFGHWPGVVAFSINGMAFNGFRVRSLGFRSVLEVTCC